MEKFTMTERQMLSFSERLLQGICAFRDHDHMIDVNLCAGMKVFPCHRLVLAATSPYFDAMFNAGLRESREYQIFIQDVSEETMEVLIHYFYTGFVDITGDNAVEVLHASDLFQIDVLKQRSEDFLTKNLNPENCLQLWRVARKFYCLTLEYESLKMVVNQFIEVAMGEQFLELTNRELCLILADDRLEVTSEEVVCDAACNWLNHEYDKRIGEFSLVLEHLRLPLVPVEYLIKCFQPYISDLSSNAVSILDEAKLYHLFPAKQTQYDSPRTKSRCNFTYRDAVMLIGSTRLSNNAVGVDIMCLDLGTMEITDTDLHTNLQTVDFAVCTYGADIYISGGSKSPTDLVHFHSADQKWKGRCPMNESRARHVMAAIGKHMYAFGGYYSGSILDSIERYSIAFDSWSSVGRLNIAVCLSVAEAVGQNIYILGGLISEQTTTSIIQSFDTTTCQVTTITNQLPLRCALHRSAVNADAIFIVNRTGKIIQHRMTSVPTIISQLENFNRGHFGVIFYHGQIYVFENDTNCLHVHKYDIDNNKWSTRIISCLTKLPVITFCIRTLVKYESIETSKTKISKS